MKLLIVGVVLGGLLGLAAYMYLERVDAELRQELDNNAVQHETMLRGAENKLEVVNNYGAQTPTYNPQKAGENR